MKPIFILQHKDLHASRITEDLNNLGHANIIRETNYRGAIQRVARDIDRGVEYHKLIFDRRVPQFYPFSADEGEAGLETAYNFLHRYNRAGLTMPQFAIWTDYTPDETPSNLFRELTTHPNNGTHLSKTYSLAELKRFIID